MYNTQLIVSKLILQACQSEYDSPQKIKCFFVKIGKKKLFFTILTNDIPGEQLLAPGGL